jgi:hypothetical protein
LERRVLFYLKPVGCRTRREWRPYKCFLLLRNSARLIELQKDTTHTQPFDWTFTTEYKGTLEKAEVQDTDEEINVGMYALNLSVQLS